MVQRAEGQRRHPGRSDTEAELRGVESNRQEGKVRREGEHVCREKAGG